jgi:O-acetyl-ADP-ribose deacetylase
LKYAIDLTDYSKSTTLLFMQKISGLNSNIRFKFLNKMAVLEIIKGDLTAMQVDAIVNPNNTQLISHAWGNGVNGAIVGTGGEQIAKECKKILIQSGECPPGSAVATRAGDLPAKNVIHTVGPVWQGGQFKEESILTDCYENCLKLAVEKGFKTVAFPNISTGNYHFPKDIAAEIAVDTILWFLKKEEGKKLEKIYLVCHNEENYQLCSKVLRKSAQETSP